MRSKRTGSNVSTFSLLSLPYVIYEKPSRGKKKFGRLTFLCGHVHSSRRNGNWCMFNHAHRSCFPFTGGTVSCLSAGKTTQTCNLATFYLRTFGRALWESIPRAALHCFECIFPRFPLPLCNGGMYCSIAYLTLLTGGQKVLLPARFPLPSSRCHYTAVKRPVVETTASPLSLPIFAS